MAPKFKYFDLKLIEPSFDSSLTDLVIEMDHLRKKQLGGTTPPLVFFQLKTCFICWRVSVQHVLRGIAQRWPR